MEPSILAPDDLHLWWIDLDVGPEEVDRLGATLMVPSG